MAVNMEVAWERFHPGLRSFILGQVRDQHVTEDILQDVYLKVYARIETLRDESKLQPWLYQVARNAIADYHRSRVATSELPELPYYPEDPLDAAMASGLNRSVKSMLECLSPEHRQALVLTEYEGLTLAELATKLGVSVSGAKSRVQRARARLKQLLLACCHFELDRYGKVLNFYQKRPDCCAGSGCGVP